MMGGLLDDPNGVTDAGAALIYTGNATNGWEFKQRITGDTAGDQFGVSIAINADGNIAMMGGPLDDPNSETNAGSAIVYYSDNTSFLYQPDFTLNFKTSGTDENQNYTEPFNLQSLNYFVENDAISFYFDENRNWTILDKIQNNFLPEHTHDIEDIAGMIFPESLVYTTGDQTISGIKNFTQRPTVNGSGVLLQGEASEGAEFKFTGDLTVTLSNGKTFGKYQNDQVIPASGKTASEVIRLAIVEAVDPNASLSVTPTELLLGTTNISNVLSRSYNINNPGASVASATLEWKRGNDPSWTVLDTSTSQTSFPHTFTNTVSNSNSINYQYRVVDSQNTTGIATANVSFLYGNYFGYNAATSLTTVTQIEALGNQFLSNSRSRTINNVNAGQNLFIYYAYRADAGDLISITDGLEQFLGAFTKQPLDIGGTNANNANVTYRVYKSNAPQAFAGVNLTFS